MKVLSIAALGAAWMSFPHAVGAQRDGSCTAAAAPAALVRCALDHSEIVARARAELAATAGRRLTAAQLVPANPTLEATIARRSPESGPVDAEGGVELAQQLEIGGQRGARLDVVRAEQIAAEMVLAAAEREVVIEVLEAVLAIERARAGARFAAEERELADRLIQVSAGRARQGLGPALDVELAEASRIQARRGELDAAHALRVAETELGLVVGADVKLAEGAGPPAAYVPDAALPELEQRALDRRPAMQAQVAEARAARARLDLLRRERIPDITLAASYKREERADVLGGRLSVSLPIFRRNQGAIAVERARIAQADAAAAQADLRVRLEVRAAHDAWQRAIAVATEIPPGLEDRLAVDVQALRDAYARGALPLATALATLREAFGARRAVADVQADAILTSLELARATGSAVATRAP